MAFGNYYLNWNGNKINYEYIFLGDNWICGYYWEKGKI